MASAVRKIKLSLSSDIPFNKLVLSQANVRTIKAGVSIEELAEDIARRGLMPGGLIVLSRMRDQSPLVSMTVISRPVS